MYRTLGDLIKVNISYNLFNSFRVILKSKDEWKVDFRIQYQLAYTGLWRVLVEQGNIDAALLTAEKGRAQALTDLIKSSFDNISPRFETYYNTAFLEESFLKSILILQIFVTTIDICWYKI